MSPDLIHWLAVLAWLIVGIWVVQLGMVAFGIRHRRILNASDQVPDRAWPRVSVLVAARNEEHCIEHCIRTLYQQDYPDFEIIAINDRSSDSTGAILDRLSTEFGDKLRVIHVSTLPAGWLGKAHAMHLGMLSATSEWLCFTDADCEYLSTRTLSLAVNQAFEQKADFLTLIPQLVLESVWEKLTVPVCSWVMMVWFQPGRVNDPRTPASYANGSFLLMTRKCYDMVGGWARVRMRICEDAAFAQVAKSMGAKLFMTQSNGLYRLPMYHSVRESWNGWSRIYYGTLSKTLLTVSIVRLLICSIIPSLIFLGALAANQLSTLLADEVWGSTFTALSIAFLFQQVQALVAFGLVGRNLKWSVTAPVANLVLVAMLTRSLLNHFGLAKLQWSGSVFTHNQAIQALFMPFPSRTGKT